MVSQPLPWFDDEHSDLEAAAYQAIAAAAVMRERQSRR